MSLLVAALASTLALANATTANDDAANTSVSAPPSYFFHELPYGSESQFSPAAVLLNGAYDILRNHSYQDSIFAVDYRAGFENLWWNLAHPLKTINTFGKKGFVAHEIAPIMGLETKYGQFVPNYTLHLLGEAMLYRKLSEWYRAYDAPVPSLLGLVTITAVQLCNEAIENGSYRGPNIDPISDVYIFNILGLALFSSDAVAAFFSGPVQLSYWPNQPVLDVRTGELFNQGENFAFKISLGSWTRVRAFAYFGDKGVFGVSVPFGEQDMVSFGVGPRLLELEPSYSNGARVMVPRGALNVDAGLFWDRKESLLASLFVGGPTNPLVYLNLYPGVLRLGGVNMGLYAIASAYEGVAAGLTVRYAPIVPGLSFRRDRSAQRF